MSTAAGVKRIQVILNGAAGFDDADSTPDALARVFREGGCESDIREVDKGTDLCELAREMVRDGAEVVVAGGGDGTVNAVASVLAGTETTLGVLPVGTLNHFARDLQIPLKAAEAAQIITQGRTVRVDVAEVNGRRFINNAIIGLYPAYRFQRDKHERRGRFKWMAMLSAVLGVFRRNPSMRLRIEAGNRTVECQTPFLMVANNRHEMEGYKLGNRRSLSTGNLSVYVMHKMSRWGLLRLAFSVLLGRFSKRKDFEVMDARSVTVESSRRTIGVSLDGEVVRMTPPLVYRSVPSSLQVIVPANFSSQS